MKSMAIFATLLSLFVVSAFATTNHVRDFAPQTGCRAPLACRYCLVEQECESRTVMCEKNEVCKVFCSEEAQCLGATIFAEEARSLELHCEKMSSCAGATVHADKALKAKVFCESEGSCDTMNFVTGSGTSEMTCRNEACRKAKVTARKGGKVILNAAGKDAMHKMHFTVEESEEEEAGRGPSVHVNCHGEGSCAKQTIDAQLARELQLNYAQFDGSVVTCPDEGKCEIDLSREMMDLPLTIHAKRGFPEGVQVNCGEYGACEQTTVHCEAGECAFEDGGIEQRCPVCSGACGGEDVPCDSEHHGDGLFGGKRVGRSSHGTYAEPYDEPPMSDDVFGGNLTCGDVASGTYDGMHRVVFDVDISGMASPYMFYMCQNTKFDAALAVFDGSSSFYEANPGSTARPIVEDDDSCAGSSTPGSSPVAVLYRGDISNNQTMFSIVIGEFDPQGENGAFEIEVICGQADVGQDPGLDPAYDMLNASETLTCEYGKNSMAVSTVGGRDALTLSMFLGGGATMDGKDVWITTGCDTMNAEDASECGITSLGLFAIDGNGDYELVTTGYYGTLMLDSTVFERMSAPMVNYTEDYVLVVAARDPQDQGLVYVQVNCVNRYYIQYDYEYPPAPVDIYPSDQLMCNSMVNGYTNQSVRTVYDVEFKDGYDLQFMTCGSSDAFPDDFFDTGMCLYYDMGNGDYMTIGCNDDADDQEMFNNETMYDIGDVYGCGANEEQSMLVIPHDLLDAMYGGDYPLKLVVGGWTYKDYGLFELKYRCGDWHNSDEPTKQGITAMQAINCGDSIEADVLLTRQLFKLDMNMAFFTDMFLSTCAQTGYEKMGMSVSVKGTYPMNDTYYELTSDADMCMDMMGMYTTGKQMYIPARQATDHLDASDQVGIVIGTSDEFNFDPMGYGKGEAYGNFTLMMTCAVGAGIPPQNGLENDAYGEYVNDLTDALSCANGSRMSKAMVADDDRAYYFVEFEQGDNKDYIFQCDNDMLSIALYSRYETTSEAQGDSNRMDAALEFDLVNMDADPYEPDTVNAIAKVYQIDYDKTHVLVVAGMMPGYGGNCTVTTMCKELDYDYMDGPAFFRDTDKSTKGDLMCNKTVTAMVNAGNRTAIPIELPSNGLDFDIFSCGSDFEAGISIYCNSDSTMPTFFTYLDDSSQRESGTNNGQLCSNGATYVPLVRADSVSFDASNDECYLVVGGASEPSASGMFNATMSCGQFYSTGAPTMSPTEDPALAATKLDPLTEDPNGVYGIAVSQGNLSAETPGVSVRGDVYATGRVSFDVDLFEIGATRCFSTCSGTTFESGLSMWAEDEATGLLIFVAGAAQNCADGRGSEICVEVVSATRRILRGAVNVDVEPAVYTTVITSTEIDSNGDFVGGKFEMAVTETSLSDTTMAPTLATPAPVDSNPSPTSPNKGDASRFSVVCAFVVATFAGILLF